MLHRSKASLKVPLGLAASMLEILREQTRRDDKTFRSASIPVNLTGKICRYLSAR